jgi:hypothetical protein
MIAMAAITNSMVETIMVTTDKWGIAIFQLKKTTDKMVHRTTTRVLTITEADQRLGAIVVVVYSMVGVVLMERMGTVGVVEVQ